MFAYEKWPVYKDALELRRLVGEICRVKAPGLAVEFRHLREAASSVVFNLTEGAGHFQPGHKLERYRTALGSVNECNGILAVLERELPKRKLIPEARKLCDSIAAQLTNLIKSIEDRGDE